MAQKFKSKSKEQLVNALRLENSNLKSQIQLLKADYDRQLERNSHLQNAIMSIGKIAESIHN